MINTKVGWREAPYDSRSARKEHYWEVSPRQAKITALEDMLKMKEDLAHLLGVSASTKSQDQIHQQHKIKKEMKASSLLALFKRD